MKLKTAPFYLILFLSLTFSLKAQNIRISGYIEDGQSQTPLPYATIWLKNQGKGTTSDEQGLFELTSKKVKDTLIVRFIGYETVRRVIDPEYNNKYRVQLIPSSQTLNEIEIKSTKSRNFESFEDLSIAKYSIDKAITMQLPSIAGEPDFIKTLLLMPGATKGLEGSSDIFVRGGDADQNLILFNSAPVYNSGHLFGFISVFNPFAVEEVTLQTSGFDAEYGGRLSSIIDVVSKKPSFDQFKMEGAIGTLSSNLAMEVPIIEDKVAISLAGRRTYADQVTKLLGESLPYYFYDVNAQLDINFSASLQLKYHFYNGRDVLDFRRVTDSGFAAGTSFDIENNTHTLSVDKAISPLWKSKTNVFYTQFRYNIFSFFQDNRLNVISNIYDLGLNHAFIFQPSENNSFKSGIDIIRHRVDPNLIDTEGELAEVIPSSEGKSRDVLEGAFYTSWKYQKNKLGWQLGLRYSMAILENKEYFNPEPRFNVKWQINENENIKLSYSRMYQYLHRVSSSSFALPTDIWCPVTDSIRPQYADQWTIGFQHLWLEKDVLFNAEVYYKKMNNLIAFREGTNLTLNNDLERSMVQGNGSSYGFEALVQKESGDFTGWLAYTLSWSDRQFDEINGGRPFRSRYDRRHNLSLVTNYEFNPRWSVSAVWEYISGARFTPLIGYTPVTNPSLTGVELIPIFPERNSVGLNDTHRLDVSVTFRGKERPGKKWLGTWQLSIYNVYNRTTPVAITLEFDENSQEYFYQQPGLFGVLPSISYRFTFN
ncbi:MAG TPA: hypothetical protein DDY13_17915 [Cytophagales bacterium]|jgi:hypothetical protein|nr:hypothetical protein [Cytophagales bacterium]